MKNSLIIGTAQLGTDYGINNSTKIKINEKFNLLNYIQSKKINQFDTAYSYINSHKILGEWIKKNKVNPILSTKIPNLNLTKKSIDIIFQEILRELNICNIDNLFLHAAENWNNIENRIYIEEALLNKKIRNFGLSIYDNQDIIKDELINIMQVPGNIFNQDIITSDKLKTFNLNKGIIHVRSIFIQGLLLMHPDLIPKKLNSAKRAISHFHNIAKDLNIKKSHLAILCVLRILPKSKIIVGIDNIEQLQSILKINVNELSKSDIDEVIKIGKKYSSKIWDPRNW